MQQIEQLARIRTAALGLLGLVLVQGCAAVYVTPQVDPTDEAVTVVPLTFTSVTTANTLTGYVPRDLPAVFYHTASASMGARGPSGLPAPVAEPEFRPARVTQRIPATSPDTPYRIGVGDVLLLASRSGGVSTGALQGLQGSTSQGFTVQDDGSIGIPDVGRVAVAGETLRGAETRIFQALIDAQIDPSFSLEVTEFNSQRVTIGGAVGGTTTIPIGLRRPTLSDAIIAAGGFRVSDPDYAAIRIFRNGSLYQVPVARYDRDPSLPRIKLEDGDMIFVDSNYDLDAAQAYFNEQIQLRALRQQARANMMAEVAAEIGVQRAAMAEVRGNFQAQLAAGAIERDYAYMVGEVASPGRFTLPFRQRPTLADALFGEAGGMRTQTASPRLIYVLRSVETPDEVIAWQLDLSNAANMPLATRFELRPNDVIYVAERPITRWNRTISLITPSLTQARAFTP